MIVYICHACASYVTIHILGLGSVKGRLNASFVLLMSSIQFTPAMQRVSSKFDPLLMKQLPSLSQANNSNAGQAAPV